jgi:release factor glutamine methyltransferase
MTCSRKVKHGELLELIAWGRAELSRAGIEESQEECERIWMKLLGCTRSVIYLREHELNLSGLRERFLTILEKRTHRIPLAYLLREADFWQETLFVDERCLIPRPETEILVEQVLSALGADARKTFSFLDIGTGSGAIAVALLRACPNARGTLLDLSGDALDVARENVKRYGLEGRANLVRGDLFDVLNPGERFDWIVSNPPYLSASDLRELQEELKVEPRQALDGGKDGFDFYRRIIQAAPGHLNPGGRLALELGQGQAERVSKWLHEAGYDNIHRFKDHLQVERVILAQRHF